MNDMSYFIQVITNGLVSSGVYILISLGLALALGVLNILNIAHGQLMIFTAYLTYWAWRLYGVDPIASILFTVPIGFLLGIVLYKGSIESPYSATHKPAASHVWHCDNSFKRNGTRVDSGR